MVRSNYKSDYQEAIGFVNVPKSRIAFYRSKRNRIIVGYRDALTNKQVSTWVDRYYNKKRSDFCLARI